jgi:hypothetical protein
MAFNPAGTRWSVATFDDNGQLGNFHPTPWEFNNLSLNGGADFAGGYTLKPGDDDAYICEIIAAGSSDPSDSFEVFFVTSNRFIATKSGTLYRFGKRA